MSSKWRRRCLAAYCAAMAVAGAARGADSSWTQWNIGNHATQFVINRDNAIYNAAGDTGILRIFPANQYFTANYGVANIEGTNVNDSVDISGKVGRVFGYVNVGTGTPASPSGMHNINAKITTFGGITGVVTTGVDAGCGVVLDAQTGSGGGAANGAIDVEISAEEGNEAVTGKVKLSAARNIKCVFVGDVNPAGINTSIAAASTTGEVSINVAGNVGAGISINDTLMPVSAKADLQVSGSVGGGIIVRSTESASVGVGGNAGGAIVVDTSTGTTGAVNVRVGGNVANLISVTSAATQNTAVNIGGTAAGINIDDSDNVNVTINGGSTWNTNIYSTGKSGTVNFVSSGDIAGVLFLRTAYGRVAASSGAVAGHVMVEALKDINLTLTGAAQSNVSLQAFTGVEANLVSVNGALSVGNLGVGDIVIAVAGNVGGNVDIRQSMASSASAIDVAIGGKVGGNVTAAGRGDTAVEIGGNVAGSVSVSSAVGNSTSAVLSGNVSGTISVISAGSGSSYLTYRGTASPAQVTLSGVHTYLTLGGRADNIVFQNGIGTPATAALIVDGPAQTASSLSNLTAAEFKHGSLTLTSPGTVNLKDTVVNGTSSLINNTGDSMYFETLTLNNKSTFTLDNAGMIKHFTVINDGLQISAGSVLNIADGVTLETNATHAGNGTIVIGDGGLLTTSFLINNGTIVLAGNSDPSACNIATGNKDFYNFGNITFGANTEIHAGTGYCLNDGVMTVSGAGARINTTGRFVNFRTLGFSHGGTLSVSSDIRNFGAVAFNLSGYTPGAAEAILTAAGGFQNTSGGKISAAGGADGTYKLITAGSALDASIINDVVAASGILNTYTAELDAANTSLLVTAHTNADIVQAAAMSDSSANAGITEALLKMSINDELPPSIRDAMNQLPDSRSVGRAISELNGHFSATASVRNTMNAISAFNNALSQVFAFDHTTRILGSNTAGLERLLPRGSSPSQVYHRQGARASAGGVPAAASDSAVYIPGCNSGFIKFFGGWGNEEAVIDGAGFSMSTFGMMLGIDQLAAQELRLGALFGYYYNQSYFGNNMGNVGDNTLRFGGYAAYNWDNFYFNTTPTAGIHLLDSERILHFLGADAAGERPSFDFNWYSEAGYTFEFPGGFMLTPSYGLSLTYLHDTEYWESGAGDASLRINAYDTLSLCQNVKMKFGKAFLINEDVILLPEIWAGWEHEYLNSSDMSMNFIAVPSTPWNAPVSDIAADRAVFGAGVNTIFSRRYEIDARYDMKLWEGGYYSHLSLELGLKF